MKGVVNISRLPGYVLPILLIFFSSCKQNKDHVPQSKAYCIPDSLYNLISIDSVRFENIQGELPLTGQITVDQDKQVHVYPLASGSVKKLYVELGDYVQQGQLLALIHSPDIAGLISAAYTSVRDLDIAKKQLEQTRELYKSGIAAEVDLITAQKNYEKQISVTRMNQEVIKIYGSDTTSLSDYYIKAPVTGFIVEKGITQGTQIRPDNGNDLFTIADLTDVWAVPNVFETDIAKIKVGCDAEVTSLSYGDKVFRGSIDKIFNMVTPDTKVMNVRVKLENRENLLKPGMFARILVHYPEPESMLSVPANAIIFEDNQNVLLRFHGKCGLEIVPVEIYKNINGRAYIKRGAIMPGDKVVNKYSLYILTDIINMK